MPAMAIGQTLDQRGSLACASLLIGRFRLAKDGIGIVAINNNAFEAVSRSAIGGRLWHSRHFADRRVLHVEIVFAHEDDRQLPDRGKIQGLMKGADIGSTVAKKTYGYVFGSFVLRAPGGASCDWKMRADDGV